VPISDPGVDDGRPALGLAAHASYACHDSGVCCSSDWEIPVEDALHSRVAVAIATGAVRPRAPGLVERSDLPAGIGSVLGRRHGRCVFHTAGPCGCGLHAWGGAEAKPIACRQFPWIAVHDPRGTFVSLSHVCPSAAEHLADPAPLRLTPLPRAASTFDGLDVRRSLPPALSRRILLDWDALSAWESQALGACARGERPEAVLSDLRALRIHARRWTAGQGSLEAWIAAWTPDTPRAATPAWVPDPALDAIVRAAAPVGLIVPPPVASVATPQWQASAPVIRRYLAARLVACWPLHYGTGLATVIAYVEALLTVVAAEITRRAAASATPDDTTVVAAIAETDRLVVHLAAPHALARGLDAWADQRGDASS